jgi:hypothetical protein
MSSNRRFVFFCAVFGGLSAILIADVDPLAGAVRWWAGGAWALAIAIAFAGRYQRDWMP